MAASDTIAISPSQVNSWPQNTGPTFMSGEPVHPSPAGPTDSERKDILLQLARERFKVCVDATMRQREEMMEDARFASGIQWDADIENRRKSQQRPCLTINRIDGFLAHTVNNMRQSRPALRVEPVGDGTDEEIAQIRQGLLRHIEVNSRADIAYDCAFEHMCKMGLGWIRVVPDWSEPDSMDQEPFIRWVPNPFAVYSDPFCQQPDWSDMKFAFVVNDMTKAEFKRKFGEDTLAASLSNYQSLGDMTAYWFPGGNIRVAEYFYIEQKADTLCEMEDGSTRLLSNLPKGMYAVKQREEGGLGLYMLNPEDEWAVPELIGRARRCQIPEIHWALISAVDVLRERTIKGKYIPLIPIIGNQTEIDGERILAGMVRYAREPQRMYNYMYTCFVETVALVPRSQYLATIDQIPDGIIKDSWQASNLSPQTVLYYKAALQDGKLIPPPRRIDASPDIAAFVQGLQMSDQNLKSIFRIFDASLGQRGPQESGLAINARKIESDTGIYNWGDNFIRGLRFLGIVLNEQLQYYYTKPGQIIHILQEDDSRKKVTLNKQFTEQGQEKIYDLSRGGKFSVVVSTGPSYQTKRQEASKAMIDFFKLYPAGLQACAHLLVGELDFPGKDKIREQLEKMLPPALQDPNENDPLPPQAMAQIQQMNQMIQGLTAALHEATDKKELEILKEQFALLREQMKQEAVLASASIKAGSQEALFLSQKLFEELNMIRAALQPQLTGPVQPGQQPSSGATPQPTTPTMGGNPSVGGA